MSARAWELRRDGARKPITRRQRAGVTRAEWARLRRVQREARVLRRRADRIPGQVPGLPRGWRHLGFTVDETSFRENDPGTLLEPGGSGPLFILTPGASVWFGPPGTRPWLVDPRPASPTRGLHITGA